MINPYIDDSELLEQVLANNHELKHEIIKLKQKTKPKITRSIISKSSISISSILFIGIIIFLFGFISAVFLTNSFFYQKGLKSGGDYYLSKYCLEKYPYNSKSYSDCNSKD